MSILTTGPCFTAELNLPTNKAAVASTFKTCAGTNHAVGGVNGNRIAYATLFSNTSTAIRPMIEPGDQTAWTATNDRVVNWTASIDEV